MLKYLSLIILTLTVSCSSVDWDNLFKGKEDTKKRNEELMKDFEVQEEVLEKFSEKPKDKAPEEKKKDVVKKTPTVKPKKTSAKRTTKEDLVQEKNKIDKSRFIFNCIKNHTFSRRRRLFDGNHAKNINSRHRRKCL